ncbi:rhodanese-like domain-containing protein [Cohnella faecalis]|uniref:Rhodanese domain-containing protein n=1 Tax=Cohnella faecalis TaxID=2315694 RepID=A0A398CNA2_9BACL|nr:rhodanese-like domain-containing protein [Cohnella faecalis]RIE03710.1 hypothetical protein D3H35_10465 [Cohnella faecalis]
MDLGAKNRSSFQPSAMSVEEVRLALSGSVRCYIYDCNPLRRFEKHRIPGSARLDPGRYTESELPADKNAFVLFYCLEVRCSASLTAARRAMEMGYENAAYMPEGINGWLEAGLQVESGSIAELQVETGSE